MYKVFFNRKFVELTTEIVVHDDTNPFFYIKFCDGKSIVNALKSKKVKGVYLYHPKKEKLWKNLLRCFPLVEAAGGLVQHANGKVLFIHRNNRWDLPKGRIEKGENEIDAAVREVIEETGVKDLIVKKPLPVTYHILSKNKKYKLKKTYWYLMFTTYNGMPIPQIEEGILRAVWKKESEIPELFENIYENIKILINNFHEK
tara:strand:- start:2568 stop:3170 length:603 start_codon:yes stop_codon:yes gene_type:complete